VSAEDSGVRDYLDTRRRGGRGKAIAAAAALLLVLGGFFFRMGRDQARLDAEVARLEALLAKADPASLKEVMGASAAALQEREKPEPRLLGLHARAVIVTQVLHTGEWRLRESARQLVEDGKAAGPESPAAVLAEAAFQAAFGSPERALLLLDGAGGTDAPALWQAVIRAEAGLRGGQPDGGAAALRGQSEPLARTWAVRVAWATGDSATLGEHAAALLQSDPQSDAGRAFTGILAARARPGEEALKALQSLFASQPPLSSENSSPVAVEMARVLRRGADGERRADEMLGTTLAAADAPAALFAEVARTSRMRGLFADAQSQVARGLAQRPDEPRMLAELAMAAFFRDDARRIEAALETLPPHAVDSDGARRGRGLVALSRGENGAALGLLASSRHLGIPGEGDLWLAEAQMRLGDIEKARAHAQRAEGLLAAAAGEGSREWALARSYSAWAQAAAGDKEGGRAAAEAVWAPGLQSFWAAWVQGRLMEAAGDPEAAKNRYLAACRNGQEFGLACAELARVYDVLGLDEARAKTQRQAWDYYLKVSPQGTHAGEARAALAQGGGD
jgi:hypothetical protein